MKTAIMQPYFFPYLGYFQLINAVDVFIVYDNIQFSKGGWIQRNRMLLNGKDEIFSLPLRKASDFLDICDRHLADDYLVRNQKTLRKLENAYFRAPFFQEVFPLLQKCFLYDRHKNLFEFLLFSIKEVLRFLNIETEIKTSSEIEEERFKNVSRVIYLCKKIQCSTYINPIGGQKIYSKQEFNAHHIDLKFLKTRDTIAYRQFGDLEFIPNLSIIDVLMFNARSEVSLLLSEYDLV